MIRLALTKGRIEKKALEYLAKAGYDVSELDEDKKGRKLLFKVGDTIEVVLAKAADAFGSGRTDLPEVCHEDGHQ